MLAMAPSDPQGTSDADRAVRRVLEARDDYFVVDGGDGPDVQARVRVRLPEAGAGPAQVEFLAAGSGTPDAAPFDRFAPASAGAAAERLLTPPTRRRSWTGMTAVALTNSGAENGSGGLRVTSVHPAGPAGWPEWNRETSCARSRAAACPTNSGLPSWSPASPGHDDRSRRTARGQRAAVASRPLRDSGASFPVGRQVQPPAGRAEADFARGRSDATRQLEAGICWILLGDPERALVRYLAR